LLPPVAAVYQPFAVNPVRASGVGRVSAVSSSVKLAVKGEIAVPPFVVALYVVTKTFIHVTSAVDDVEAECVLLPE
jgi:hypothetical protein